MASPVLQILDKNNKPVGINTLDREVCELWNVPIHKKSYACEKPRSDYPKGIKGSFEHMQQSDWYHTLGWQIANGNIKSWIELRAYLAKELLEITDKFTYEEMFPKRVQLIAYWEAKGYTPNGFDK